MAKNEICEICQCSTCLKTMPVGSSNDCYRCEICFEDIDGPMEGCTKYDGPVNKYLGMVKITKK